MKKCAVCGEIVEDGVDVCPVCKAKKFVPVAADTKYACEHVVGDGKVEEIGRASCRDRVWYLV